MARVESLDLFYFLGNVPEGSPQEKVLTDLRFLLNQSSLNWTDFVKTDLTNSWDHRNPRKQAFINLTAIGMACYDLFNHTAISRGFLPRFSMAIESFVGSNDLIGRLGRMAGTAVFSSESPITKEDPVYRLFTQFTHDASPLAHLTDEEVDLIVLTAK